MAFTLKLPASLARQWAVKIRDRERVEPPHVTILRRTQAWRLGLRTRAFMDAVPEPDDVPTALLDLLFAHWDELCAEWDAMYPENPVASTDDEESTDE